jgi:hypothetical protein
MRKEEVMGYFKVLYWNLLGGARENHENPLRKFGFWAEI